MRLRLYRESSIDLNDSQLTTTRFAVGKTLFRDHQML
jgi:hypothetical protein